MSLVATRLLNFRAAAALDKYEERRSRWGFMDLFQRQSNDPAGIISDELRQKAIDSVGSGLEVPVIDYNSGVTIANTTQPVVITGVENTSALYTVSFTDYYWGFLIYPARHKNNEISMQREFNRQMVQHIHRFMDSLDNAGLTALEAAKTQVLNDDLGGRYTLTANVVVAPLAEQDAVIGDLNPLMGGNDFYGPIDVVANPSLESHVRNRLLEQGQFNERDKQYQYNDKTFYFSNNLSNGLGHKATGFAVQGGSVGWVQQFSPDAVMGHETHKHTWDIETLPIANMPIGVYGYEDAVDLSALDASTSHLTATKVEAYGFHTSVAFLTAYNSAPVTRASSVMKVAISAT